MLRERERPAAGQFVKDALGPAGDVHHQLAIPGLADAIMVAVSDVGLAWDAPLLLPFAENRVVSLGGPSIEGMGSGGTGSKERQNHQQFGCRR